MRLDVRPTRTRGSALRHRLFLPLTVLLATTGALAVTTPAAADEDSPKKVQVWTKSADGYIVAVARVPFAADTILDYMADGARAHRLAPTTVKAQKLSGDGTCERLRLTVRGLFSPFVVDTRRCRTANGYHETMISSDDFEAYDVIWEIEPVGDDSMISFRAKNVLSISIPEGLQIRESKKVMSKTVKNLAKALRD